MIWWSPNNRKGFASKIFETSGDNLVSKFKTEGRNKIKNVLLIKYMLIKNRQVYSNWIIIIDIFKIC